MSDGSEEFGLGALDDAALVDRARRGDARAFEALAARHYEPIRRFAWRRCGDATDAEDVAQETLIRIARSLDRFEGRSAFSTWAFGIALNAARDRGRAEARRGAIEREALALARLDQDEAPGDDMTDELWAAVDALPEPQRDAVLLVHVEGLTHAQAAQALGCAEATVSWRLFSARRRLKSALSRKGA
ncbi:RNA polymerase sigma factor [Chenggangzhangella methanolivorans]|uniref:RNA polymerase sigma factor n=1 Tax=Chenggangzhangella methanolivorans TaxID=1437009 RepID=UPI0036225D7C